MDLTEDELKPLYKWIDQIPLSRPKRNIARDFSDGVLVAECIAHFYPKLVELHNYSSANAMSPKVYNWQTLNQRALKKLGFQIPREDFMDVCNCRAGAIERVLKLCKFKMAEFQAKHGIAGKGTSTFASHNASGGASGGGGGGGGGQRIGPNGDGSPGTYEGDAVFAASPSRNVVLCEQCGHANHASASKGARHLSGILKNTQNINAPADLFSRKRADDEGENETGDGDGADPILAKKNAVIAELRETNSILDAKGRKLEQLVRLKDAKIQTLLNKLQALGALRLE